MIEHLRFVVTDLTRFSNREIICLAGLEASGRCIRPMENGNPPRYISYNTARQAQILPGSILEGSFSKLPVDLPHSEDYLARGQWHIVGAASSDEFEETLESTSFDSVHEGFGMAPIERRFSGNPAFPQTSIITLRLSNPSNQIRIVEDRFNPAKLKAHIIDGAGKNFDFMPITDLGFSDHAIALREAHGGLYKLNDFLHQQGRAYVRLGLSRPYTDPNGRSGCWLQVNGIYTFPNYRIDLRQYD